MVENEQDSIQPPETKPWDGGHWWITAIVGVVAWLIMATALIFIIADIVSVVL